MSETAKEKQPTSEELLAKAAEQVKKEIGEIEANLVTLKAKKKDLETTLKKLSK